MSMPNPRLGVAAFAVLSLMVTSPSAAQLAARLVLPPPRRIAADELHTSVSALRHFVGGLKARGGERRLGYWEARLAQLELRAYPFDTIDPSRWLDAREHRDRMPAMPRPDGSGPRALGGAWTFVGPRNLIPTARRCFGLGAVSGNALCAAYHPSVPGLYFVGTAGGGLWRSTDYGASWTCLSSSWPAMAVQAVAVDPVDPNTIFVGIGQWSAWECHPSGIWRTTDGGATWSDVTPPHISTQMVRTVVIDPDNHQIVMFGTTQIGAIAGSLYRSTDGGSTWVRKLSGTPIRWAQITYSLMNGQGVRRCYALGEGGSGHLYTSIDHGDSWAPATLPFTAGADNHQNGLRMACSATDPARIYAVSGRDKSIQTSASEGQAGTWTDITGPMATTFEGNWYQYSGDILLACTKSSTLPSAHDVLYLGLVCMFQSPNADGGWREFTFDNEETIAHVDQHFVTFNPANPAEMLFTNDGGIYRALYSPGPDTWTIDSLNADLEVTQFYRMAAHPTDVNAVLGGTQDNATPAWCGPDRGWLVQGAGDGCMGAISSADPNVRYAGWLDGGLQITANAWAGPNPEITPDVGTDRRSSFVPIATDPSDSRVLYYGTNYLWRYDRTGTWEGTWVPRLGSTVLAPASTLSYIAVAPSNSNYIYTGAGNGRVWMSSDRGANWRRIDDTSSPLPDRSITSIAVHPTKPYFVLLTTGGTGAGHVWRCNDTRAASPVWSSIDGDADGTSRLAEIHAVSVVFDPYDPDSTYYCANDVGVYATMDAGHHWSNAGWPLGLPNAQPTDLAVASGSKNLYVSTFGRGIWRMQLRATGVLIQEPNGAFDIERGDLLQVRWVAKGKPGTTCTLYLCEGGTRIRSLATGQDVAAGYFDWHIPVSEPLRADCRIEIATSDGYTDRSDNGFRIIERTALDVTSPDGSVVWTKGSTRSIRWTYTGTPGPYVRIDLVRGGSVVRTIKSATPTGAGGSNHFSWQVPADQVPHDDYQVRITDTSDATHTDTGPYFEIADATAISVTAPDADDNWHMGTTQTIRWTYSGSPGLMIGIKLYRSGTVVRTIVGMMSIGSDGSGSYDWTLPNDLTPNSGYTIRVGNEITSGESAQFTIAAVRCRMRVDEAEGRIAYPVNLRCVLTNWYTGEALAGMPIRFRINSTDIGGATTNASGEGRLTYTLPEIWAPTGHALYADFAGDATHSPISGIASLTITKGVAVAVAGPASGFATQMIELWGRLFAHPNSDPIVGRVLRFSIDGTHVDEETTEATGSVRFPYRIPELDPGAHTITAAFDGDKWYEAATDTDTLTVLKCDTFLIPRPVAGQVGETVTLSASLTRQGDLFPLVGRTLIFRVSGTEVGVGATQFDGVAEVDYTIPTSLGVGFKTYQVEYPGETCYVGHTQTGGLTVSKADVSIEVSPASVRVGGSYSARARLTRASDGVPLSGKVVQFSYDGYEIGQGTADGDGWAQAEGTAYEGISVGDHVLRGTFAGDPLHKSGFGDGVLTIAKADTTLWTVNRSGTISELVTLRAYDLKRTTDNAFLEARPITFSVDGTVVGTVKANDSGDASLNWAIAEGPASRAITTAFAGNDYYNPSSASATLTCLSWTTKMVPFPRTGRITDRTELKARLLRGDNVPLPWKGIDFSIDGTFVITRNTNGDGYASYPYYDIPDGAGAGVRTILSAWPGNGGYAAISRTADLTVLKALPYIWVLSKNVPQGSYISLYSYFRRLYDYRKQGGKPVVWRIDGTQIHAMDTDANGVASFPYRVTQTVGDHTMRCEFAGDAWLEAGYGEGTLRVY